MSGAALSRSRVLGCCSRSFRCVTTATGGGAMPTPPETIPRSMLGLIREHNRLNGLGFVIAECLLVGAVGLVIALGGGWGLLLGGGIALNMATVALVAIGQLRHG